MYCYAIDVYCVVVVGKDGTIRLYVHKRERERERKEKNRDRLKLREETKGEF